MWRHYFSPLLEVCGVILQGKAVSLCQLMAWCVTFVLVKQSDESGHMHKGLLSPGRNSLGLLLASPEDKGLGPQVQGLGFPSKVLSIALALSLLTCLFCQCSGPRGWSGPWNGPHCLGLQPLLWVPPSAHWRRNEAAYIGEMQLQVKWESLFGGGCKSGRQAFVRLLLV